ncbi:phosphodiester glycosidase family protein [bacterium]|nr:phosphodiester glycosidase family protein [bacterium]
MDTLILQRPRYEKAATSAAGIGIAICLLFTQNLWISAKDITGVTGLSPTINYLRDRQKIQEQIFEQEILSKYKNQSVAEVEKGVKHVRMTKYYGQKPVRINIVEISRNVNDSLEIEPAIASKTLASRSKITNIADRENAIVAINGGYFKPQTGTPLGTLMINKKVYTGPIYDRVAMGIFDNGYEMARVQLRAEVKTNIGGLKIDNVNQPRMLSVHTIAYTPDWGVSSPDSPKYGMQIVVADGKIVKTSYESSVIPHNGFVLVGPESKLKTIAGAKHLTLDLNINPEWKGVNHIISGGPYLVKNGEIYVDMTEQKLTAIGGRNPRTAIGYTRDGNLIMLTADGREGASIGLTLNELAVLMKELGCINAMNLDGGGSTVMFVNGQVVNKPAVQGGIPLSHTLMVRKVS